MQDYIARYGFGNTQAIVDYAYALVTKYGEGSAALAAEMYDETAALSGQVLPPAVVADTANYGEVAKAIYGTIKRSKNPSSCGSTVSRYVKMAGADTTLKNAERDGAQFAWVPMGDTCSFCLTLASRGWQYMSRKAMKNGHAEHIHANCDCTYSIRFDSKSGVKGYDPDKYLAMYNNAEGNTPKEKINSMRRMQYQDPAVRNKIRAQKREAYAETHNILTKSLSIDDFNKIKTSQKKIDEDQAIKPEVIDAIRTSLENQGGMKKFKNILVQSRDDGVVFDTIMTPNGNWYNCNLVINSNFFGGLDQDDIERIISQSTFTVCNSLDDCVAHEILHAKQTENAFASVVKQYNDAAGIKNISECASKDMLETLAEAGVLRKNGQYATIAEKDRAIIDSAAKELGLW